MNKILLINYESVRDTYTLANLVNFIKNKNPKSDISIVTDKKLKNKVGLIKNLNYYCIDREKIISIILNPAISESFAFNEFIDPIQEVKKRSWDYVINIGNDDTSIALASYIKGKKNIGISLNKDKSKKYSNYWARIYHYYSLIPYNIGLSYSEILHRMLGLDWDVDINRTYLISGSKNIEIDKKISEIKKRCFENNQEKNIIGILIKDDKEKISFNILNDFLKVCMDRGDIFPLFLIPKSKDLINSKQYDVNHVVQYEDKSLPYLLNHIDVVITFSSSFYPQINTSSLRVYSRDSDPSIEMLPPEGGLVIQCLGSDYNSLQVNDLLEGCLYILLKDKGTYKFSNNATVYRPLKKDHYRGYIPIGGEINVCGELTKIMAKDFIYAYDDDKNISLSPRFYRNIFQESDIKIWIEKEKQYLNQTIKSLLRCMRVVKQFRFKKAQGNYFIKVLESFMNLSSSPSITAIPILVFKMEVDSITSHDYDNNIALFEEKLFSLKRRIHEIYKLVNSLDQEDISLRSVL